MRLTSRPATRADVDHFYPGVTCSFRAFVCEMDGHPAGIIGIALKRDDPSIFCTFDERLRPHLRCLTVLRLLKWLDRELSRRRGPVFAVRERGEREAVRILKRLGFSFFDVIDGDAIYWRG